MINAIGAYIVGIIALALIREGPSCERIESALQRFGSTGRAAIAAYLLAGAWLASITTPTVEMSYFLWIAISIPGIASLWIHEGGHFFMLPLGFFMNVAGGTLFQLGVPLGLAIRFYRRGCGAAAWTSIAWGAASLIHTAIYIGDARAQKLPLLGGEGSHDWNYLLNELQLLSYDTVIASIVLGAGWIIHIGALTLLIRAENQLDREALH